MKNCGDSAVLPKLSIYHRSIRVLVDNHIKNINCSLFPIDRRCMTSLTAVMMRDGEGEV